ncbi:MAG: M23 family metallopeptidase [Leptolyngbyaceae cyanobacterium SM2_3_12]|nr:M23 family metallopeptidase [Leptolyngbyaceae cyanobacterium SM2_3_12]
MAFRHVKPRTVLIMAPGKKSILLTVHPVSIGLGLALLFGLSLGWIGLLIQQNTHLAQRNQNLAETANEVLSDLNEIGAEIEVLKDRAGLPAQATPVPLSPAATTPQGGSFSVAPPEEMFDRAQRELPGLEAMLSTSVKPALEETLESEAEQQAAFPNGKPIAGKLDVSSEFGLRANPFGGRNYEMHEGIDLGGPIGKPILTTAEGVVVKAEYNSGYGNHVKVDHGYNYETLYAHLSGLEVQIGDRVQRGDVVGYLGNTGRSSGPHLHYGVYRNGQAVNPRYYLKLEEAR